MAGRARQDPLGIEIAPGYDQMCEMAASRILAVARRAIAARGRFSVALSGGSTPRGVYERLASPSLASSAGWPAWRIFWGDERWVPPQHPLSNYHMAQTALLDHVPVERAHVHPLIPPVPLSSVQPAEVARAYEITLESELALTEGSDANRVGTRRRPPRIDLVLLGLGGDGHTASLFPGASALEETKRWAVATPAPGGEDERKLPRLTLTLPVLNAAHEVIFLVSGAAKSSIVAAVLKGAEVVAPERWPEPLPAARVVPTEGRLTWVLDEDAAGGLEPVRDGATVS